MLRAESGAGSRTNLGRSLSLRLPFELSINGAGLPLSSLRVDKRVCGSVSFEVTLTFELDFCLSVLTALRILSLSPMLVTPISCKVVWSSSSKMSPLISFALKVAAWSPHFISVSQRATWESFHRLINSTYETPGGGSKNPSVGVVGKGEFWPRIGLC